MSEALGLVFVLIVAGLALYADWRKNFFLSHPRSPLHFRSLKMERGGAGQTVTGDPGLDGGLCSVCDGLKRHGV